MIERFLNYLRLERGRSTLTIEEYRRDLKGFESFFSCFENHPSWESVDSTVIRSWMEHMLDEGISASSVNRRLSSLRSLYRFAMSRHLVTRNPTFGVHAPKKAKPLPSFLKEGQMENLLDGMDWGEDFKGVRDRTILLVFYETGVRLSELIGLDDEDFDCSQRVVRVLGKRNKQRVIPYGEELVQVLEAYLEIRRRDICRKSSAFFLTEKGERMTPSQVRYIVEKHLKKACTLKKVSPHVLRHTFATTILNHGADLESTKRLLGHASLTTTEVYTHVTFERLKQEYRTAHPRA